MNLLNAPQQGIMYALYTDRVEYKKYNLQELSEELDGKVGVYSIDVDQNPSLAIDYKIMNIPALVLLKDGEKVGMTVGFQPKASLEKFIEEHK